MKTGKTYGRMWTVGPWQHGDKCGGCEVVCTGDDRPKNTYRIAPLDVHAVIAALCATTGQVVADPAAIATLRKPEREVVGWVVRTSSEYESYARDVAGDTFGWNSTAARPTPVSRQDAIGLLNRCRLWSESGGFRWTFRLVRITRRKKAEVG